MKIAVKEVSFTDLVWFIARTKFTLFSMESEVIGQSADFLLPIMGHLLKADCSKVEFRCRLLFQHIRELSRGKHDRLLVYDVEADKAKGALTPRFRIH